MLKACIFLVLGFPLIIANGATAWAADCREIVVRQKGTLGDMSVTFPVQLYIGDNRPSSFYGPQPPLIQTVGTESSLEVLEGTASIGVDTRELRGAPLIVDSATQVDTIAANTKVYAVRLRFVSPALNQKYVPIPMFGICTE